MRTIATFCCLLLLCGASCTTASVAESVVRRSTFLVADIETSVAFYEGIGFRVWLDRGGERDQAASRRFV